MTRLLRLAIATAAYVIGQAAGRAHQRSCPFGTRYWRAQAELALALYDEPRLVRIQAQVPGRQQFVLLDRALDLSTRLVEPVRRPRPHK